MFSENSRVVVLMMSVLVLFDTYAVGGRETYVTEIMHEIKAKLGLRCGLIAQSIIGGVGLTIFDHTFETRDHKFAFKENSELQQFFTKLAPRLIWAQHSEFIQGLVMSTRYQVPLLPTFHTPFAEGTVWNDPMLSLGTALVINRCPLIAGVSDEILRSLADLGADESKLRLLPNRVRMAKHLTVSAKTGSTYSTSKPQVVLLTRSRKYGHIRAAMEYFHALRKRLPRARMTIYCADNFGGRAFFQTGTLSKLKLAKRLMGSGWLARNLWVLRDLSAVDFRASTTDARSVLMNADIVLGMGRVILEGLSLGKISVLVGYRDVVEMVTSKNFSNLKFSNLSGRGITPSPLDAIVTSTIEKLHEGYVAPSEILNEIDLSAHWEGYANLLADAADKWKSSEWTNSNTNARFINALSFEDLLSIANKQEIDSFRKLNNLSSKPLIIS